MNRLIRIMVSFVLPFFCLLINVSYAEFNTTPILSDSGFLNGKMSGLSTYDDYTYFINDVEVSYTTRQIYNIVSNYIKDSNNSEYVSLYNNMISYFKNDLNCNVILGTKDSKFSLWFWEKTSPVSLGFSLGWNQANPFVCMTGSTGTGHVYAMQYNNGLYWREGDVEVGRVSGTPIKDIIYSSVDVKDVKYVNDVGFTWDGTSYYYEAIEEPEEETPTLPSNAEIAQAVQAFYNSDYYKNNTEFDDFFVLYNYDTKYFDFVGHNFGINIGQVIVPPDYEYEGYSYNQDWWKFFLRNVSSQISSNLWNRYYWLYSTNDFGENITYDGKGSISSLIDLHFSTKSIIVYSTTDYPVVKIETDENGVLSPVEGTVPGDQYTYDEKLDPTTNEYNPLENFVPTNPTQNILGNVDFDEINKTFEENKDILNIEGASWLFTANNKLVGYFIGFLSLLIVFLIISRILGG